MTSEPYCRSCGVKFINHPGIEGTCKQLREAKQETLDMLKRLEKEGIDMMESSGSLAGCHWTAIKREIKRLEDE